MKQHKWIMALAAVGLLALALPARGQVGAEGVKAQSLTGQRIILVGPDSTQYLLRTDANGNPQFEESNPLSAQHLSPTLIYSGTIAAGAADSSSIVDLSTYRTVALLFQIMKNGLNDYNRYAVNARYNLGGASDSLSLFTLPVSSAMDTLVTTMGAVPGAAAAGYGEFVVTLPMTGTLTAAAATSLPQGKVVWLTVPSGFVWPSNCSFRFRNIGREGTVSISPTIRVWVMGTAL